MTSDFVIDYKYNYKENRLEVKTDDVFDFDLVLRAPITLIRWESATGKSLLVNSIEQIQQARKINDWTTDKVVIFTTNKVIDFEDEKQLIIIDRGDLCLTENICEKIRKCQETRFLIMARGSYNLGLTPNYVANLVQENGIVKLQFEFSERLWFI